MTEEYALADKLKQQFRGRGASVSGMRATSTSELMHRAEMGRDPGENVSEEAFRELNGNPSREKSYRSAAPHRNPESEGAAPSRPRPQASRRSDVNEQIAGRGHIPYNPPAPPSDSKSAREAKKAAKRRERERRKREKQREEAASGANEIVVTRGNFPVAFLALCLVAIVVIFSLVESFAKVYQTQNRISGMEAQLEELRETADGLRLKLDEKNDIRTIRDIAVGELGMTEEESLQRRFVSISDGERIELLESEESGTSPGGVLFSSVYSSLRDFFERFR